LAAPFFAAIAIRERKLHDKKTLEGNLEYGK
jgi:hypothetical protein